MSISVRVRRISYEAERINSYELVPIGQSTLPPFTAGAHIDVELPGGLKRQYSLHNRPGERHRYVIAVLHLPASQGGSDVLHKRTRVGDILTISEPRNHFELMESASRYILVAGGIGITPLMSMVSRLGELDARFVLHYCARSPETTAFCENLAPLAEEGKVHMHFDGGVPGEGLDVAGLFRDYQQGTHIFCCGPAGLMSAVRSATSHWPGAAVHFESFAPPPLAKAADDQTSEWDFEVELASTARVIGVPRDKTLLQALRDHDVSVDSSCEAGTCGTCKTRYLEGVPDHQDFVLSDEEQREFMMVCVSRAKSPRLKLDL